MGEYPIHASIRKNNSHFFDSNILISGLDSAGKQTVYENSGSTMRYFQV
jgi:hypothetical protein